MSALASALVNWGALWKIVVAALIGGAGVVIVFGLALIALERARATANGGTRLAHRMLAGSCGLFCVGAVTIGIYAMVEKPSSKSAPKPTSAGLSAGPRRATN